MSPSKVNKHTRAEHVFYAKLAEEAERYQDVIDEIKSITNEYGAQLTIDERNLLSVAYKNTTNSLRNSWRIIDSLEKLQEAKHSEEFANRVHLVRIQRERIEAELTDVCKDIVGLLGDCLLPVAKQGEEQVFYYKMKGDYYRYLAEFALKSDREKYADLSLLAYKTAYKHALVTLEPAHPTRLGLALNFSVYFHDVKKSPERACHLAKHALDEACLSFDSDGDVGPNMRDSIMILVILRDDIVLWSAEMQSPQSKVKKL